MAWTTPKTWTVGELLTAADLNTYIRDNSDFLAETPKVAVRLTSTQSVPDDTTTTVSWDEAVWETDASMWDGASPTKIVIPRDGLYDIDCHVKWATSADPTDEREIKILVEGSERINGTAIPTATHAHSLQLLSTNLATDDEIEIQVTQATGGALNMQATVTRLVVAWSSLEP